VSKSKRHAPAARRPPPGSPPGSPAHAGPSPAGPAPARPASRAALRLLVAMMAAYFLLYGFLSALKFRYYLYIDFDLAIFVQATARVLHGSLFSSIRGMNWLGDHVSLILFVIAPIYAIFHHPLTLLLLQCLALALGALPVFAVARRRLGDERVALALAALYLLHPAIGFTNLFEFHPEVLATGTLLATFWALDSGRLGATLLFGALSVACREDVALVVLMMGLTGLLPGRARRPAIALLSLAVLSLLLSFAVIRPRFASTAADYGLMYKDWGGSLGQVALHVLRHPFSAVAAFFSTPGDLADSALKRLYWLHMMAPLLFLPLLAPVTLAVALPVLAEHFLSSRSQQHWLLFQYTALVTPVFVMAAVHGMEQLVFLVAGGRSAATGLARPGPARALVSPLCGVALATSCVCGLLYGPLVRVGGLDVPRRPEPLWPSAFDRARLRYRDRMVARVPREGGVVAGFEYLARLASRPEVHSMHHILTGYYTYSTRRYPVPDGIHAVLADIGDERLAHYVTPSTPLRMRELMIRNDLHPVDAAGDLVLYVRAPADTAELLRVAAPEPGVARAVTYDGQLTFAGYTMPDSAVAPGDLLPLETCWRRVAPADRQFMFQLVIRDAAGEAVFSVVRHLGYMLYPVAEWPAETLVRESYRLVIPPMLPAGEYSLNLRVVWWRQGPMQVSQPDDPALAAQGLLVPLGRFTVTARGPLGNAR
jgi:uncharacterized membrane protein